MHFTTVFGAAALLMNSLASAGIFPGPAASVVWAPTNRVRVYSLDPDGKVIEWTQTDNGYVYNMWKYIGAQATVNSSITAVYTTNKVPTINLFYRELAGGYRQMIYTDASGWADGGGIP